MEGGLDTPEAYAEFALQCKARGYTAFKLHTWQPPVPGAPDPRRDVAACAAGSLVGFDTGDAWMFRRVGGGAVQSCV